MKDNRLSRTPEQLDAEVARHRVQEAGDLEAGVLKAGSPGIVSATPELRQKAIMMLRDRWGNAQQLFKDSFYCAHQPGARQIDMVILHEAQQNRIVLLWMAQCMGLIEVADDMQRDMTLDEDEGTLVRIAQDVAEARAAR